ncbi:AAA family ATPase [Paraburkholderia sp. MM6662-R1]|uniref:AAA family ATPase n=1 Tax=Paraburkholderia sp. MM6662-R1 TaxID=2991066 RepID=UPI003D20E8A5
MNPSADPIKYEIVVRNVLSVLSNGAAIFSGSTSSGETLKVVATTKSMARVPVEGETWSVDGHLRLHESHGWQLHAVKCLHVLPRGRLIERYLVENFEGIGVAKAAALWMSFGENLIELLDSGNVDALKEVVSSQVARRLVLGWRERRGDAELIAFLDAHGFDWALSSKLIRVWGNDAFSMLTRNPYHLIAFETWPKVDAAGLKLGVARDDERRLIGAVEATIYDRLLEGHTLTAASVLIDGVERRLKRREGEVAIQCALRERAITGNAPEGYQAVGAAVMEKGLTLRITRMLATVPEPRGFTRIVDPDDRAEQILRTVEDSLGFHFNKEQRLAAWLPFHARFSVLSGGAGVGKTAVLKAVIALAEQEGVTVIQMALAGLAAQKMASATGHPATTIAKFLRSVRAGSLRLSDRCLLLIDEASMLDLPTFYRVFQFVPDGASILLVGDPAQLPPLNFGLVFHRLVDNVRVPRVRLTEVHRQADSSGIPLAAGAVRNRRLPTFVPFQGVHNGVSFLECSPEQVSHWLRHLSHVWRHEEWRALSPLKVGATGARAINEAFHLEALLRSGTNGTFVADEPVIHMVNDYDRGLMNGSLGRVVALHDCGDVAIDFEGEVHTVKPDEMKRKIELAYAISVHKAQGSQFGRVAVAVSQSRILDNSLIYTALTRGVHQVVFIGDLKAFETAVLMPPHAGSRSVAFNV